MSERQPPDTRRSRILVWLSLFLGLMALCFLLPGLAHGIVPEWMASWLVDLAPLMAVVFLAAEAFFFYRDHHLRWWLIHLSVGWLLALLVLAGFIISLLGIFAMAHMIPSGEWGGLLLPLAAGLGLGVPVTFGLTVGYSLWLRRRKQYPPSRLEALNLAVAVILAPVCVLWVATRTPTKIYRDLTHLAQGRDRFGNTRLIRAAERGDVAKVQELIQRGADVNERNAFGETALHRAATCGNQTVVEKLLEHGANVNAQDGASHTPLIHAFDSGNLREELAGQGLARFEENPLEPGSDSCQPVVSIGIIQGLIKAGADVNARDGHGKTPLMYAAEGGSAEGVRELIKAGADVNASVGGSASKIAGMTPLMYAAEGGFTEVVKELIKGGADVNAQNQWGGWRALSLAKRGGHGEIVQLLEEAHAIE